MSRNREYRSESAARTFEVVANLVAVDGARARVAREALHGKRLCLRHPSRRRASRRGRSRALQWTAGANSVCRRSARGRAPPARRGGAGKERARYLRHLSAPQASSQRRCAGAGTVVRSAAGHALVSVPEQAEAAASGRRQAPGSPGRRRRSVQKRRTQAAVPRRATRTVSQRAERRAQAPAFSGAALRRPRHSSRRSGQRSLRAVPRKRSGFAAPVIPPPCSGVRARRGREEAAEVARISLSWR